MGRRRKWVVSLRLRPLVLSWRPPSPKCLSGRKLGEPIAHCSEKSLFALLGTEPRFLGRAATSWVAISIQDETSYVERLHVFPHTRSWSTWCSLLPVQVLFKERTNNQYTGCLGDRVDMWLSVPSRGKKFFSTKSSQILGPRQPHLQWVTESHLPGLKRP